MRLGPPAHRVEAASSRPLWSCRPAEACLLDHVRHSNLLLHEGGQFSISPAGSVFHVAAPMPVFPDFPCSACTLPPKEGDCSEQHLLLSSIHESFTAPRGETFGECMHW